MKVIIVGGVAGGASCAARLRRLDEKAEILMVEKGPYVSYANCGLPYHLSGVIAKESSLLVATRAGVPQPVRGRGADGLRGGRRSRRSEKTVELQGSRDRRGDHRALRQARALAGGAPIRPPLPGIDLPGIFGGEDRAGCAGDPRLDR